MLDEIDKRKAAVLDVAALEQQQQQNGKAKKSRRWWVRPWLTEHERSKKGQYHQLLMLNDFQYHLPFYRILVADKRRFGSFASPIN